MCTLVQQTLAEVFASGGGPTTLDGAVHYHTFDVQEHDCVQQVDGVSSSQLATSDL